MKTVEGWRKLIAFIFTGAFLLILRWVEFSDKLPLSSESTATYLVYAFFGFIGLNTVEWGIKRFKGKGE